MLRLSGARLPVDYNRPGAWVSARGRPACIGRVSARAMKSRMRGGLWESRDVGLRAAVVAS